MCDKSRDLGDILSLPIQKFCRLGTIAAGRFLRLGVADVELKSIDIKLFLKSDFRDVPDGCQAIHIAAGYGLIDNDTICLWLRDGRRVVASKVPIKNETYTHVLVSVTPDPLKPIPWKSDGEHQ